jgi:hypothetical protein
VGQKGWGKGRDEQCMALGVKELAFRECAALCIPWKIVVVRARCIIAIDVIMFFFCKGLEGILLLRDSKILLGVQHARGSKCLCGGRAEAEVRVR